MSSFLEAMRPARALAGLMLAAAAATGVWAQSSGPFPGIGRPATPQEIAAWDIDVRPDFKGLPKGSGTVAQGMDIWEAKCASCHGVFGESNEVFSPLVGGTTKEDVRTGRARRLTDESFPGRTTMMKLSSVATLWDYINRAMPWNAPKTLSADEVYAVTAYILSLGSIVPEDFVLSDRNMAMVQERLPNRNGLRRHDDLWLTRGRGDVRNVACMRDCKVPLEITSLLPDYARDAHGNLAEQNRLVGAQHGADTTKPGSAAPVRLAAAPPGSAAPAAPAASAPAAAPAAPAAGNAAAIALFNKHSCNACHGIDRKLVGPGMQEVARKVAARADRVEYLSAKIVGGGAGVWGAIPMPPQNLPKADADAIARWVAAGAGK